MRAACSDLTYITIPPGHWLTHEQPAAVSYLPVVGDPACVVRASWRYEG